MRSANVHYGAVTPTETSGTISFACPQCSWTGEFDLRYPAWCGRCEHGLSALSAEELAERGREKGRHRRRREAARRRAEEIEAGLAGVGDLRPGGAVRLAAMAAATVVHLMGLAVLAAGVWLLTRGLVIGYIGGALCIAVAWTVRPRIGKLNKKKVEWRGRDELPLFFGLLDRTAAPIGAPVPRFVALTATYGRGGVYFNASTARLGLRRTPVLTMGLPLWQVLSRQERLAVLGHELGHQVNGDMTGSLFVGSARISLYQWQHLFSPPGGARIDWGGSRTFRRGGIAELLATLAMLPLYFAALLLARLFAWIDVHVSLRAEYLADEMAARVAGTEAAIGVMRKLSIGRTVVIHLNREKARRGVGAAVTRGRVTPEAGAEVWANLDAHLASVPEHEYERQVRVSEFRGTAADDDHPATYLRMRLLRDRPLRAAALDVSVEEWEAVEKELYPHVAAAGVALVR